MATQKADGIFLTGSFRRLSRLYLFIGLIYMMMMISACGNPVGYSDMNDEFLSYHPEMRKIAVQKMEEAKANLHTLDDVRELQKHFHYVYEPVNLVPTIEVLFARDLTYNCVGAAVLGQWSLAQIGIKSRRVDLYGDGIHEVCISDDNTIMISNNEVVMIPQKEWKEAVLTWFKPAYSSLKDVN